ncbi:MAG: response regulator [Anaerolineae bacterium]
MRVLIVEDDATSRLLMHRLVERYGDCHVAANGREALQAVMAALDGGHPYDLICLDIMMPEMDGQAALRGIRAVEEARGTPRHHRAKVVMTTALGHEASVARAIQGQCDGYLVKPIDMRVLVALLQQWQLVS